MTASTVGPAAIPATALPAGNAGPAAAGAALARFHGPPRTAPSPARCAAVTSGNSSGLASVSPGSAGPEPTMAGSPGPRVTSATGHSCTWSAPTSPATRASGNQV